MEKIEYYLELYNKDGSLIDTEFFSVVPEREPFNSEYSEFEDVEKQAEEIAKERMEDNNADYYLLFIDEI